MKILVTGGAGFIGSNLVRELERNGHAVTVLDNMSSGNMKNLKGFKGNVIAKAILDYECDFAVKYDVIFHQASITDTTFPNDREMLEQNVEGFKKVLNIALKLNAKLIYASSAGIYGNGPVPMKEEQEPSPLNAYAKSKCEMDTIAKQHLDKLHIVGLRYFNVFGPGEEFKGRSSSMIFQLCQKMLRNEKPRLFRYGEQKRDHIFINDVVRANMLAIKVKRRGIYNIGTGIASDFNELVALLNVSLGMNYGVDYFDNPHLDVYQINTRASTDNAVEFLGFKAEYKLADGIMDYVKYIRGLKC